MKIVNDEFEYRDKNKKSLGYHITEGKKRVKLNKLEISNNRGVKKKAKIVVKSMD